MLKLTEADLLSAHLRQKKGTIKVCSNTPGTYVYLETGPCIHCGAYDGDHDEGCSYLEDK